MVGAIFANGLHTKEVALELTKKACDANVGDACYYAVLVLSSQPNDPAALEQAKVMLNKACTLKSAQACQAVAAFGTQVGVEVRVLDG